MKIKYEMDGVSCLTDCPNGKGDLINSTFVIYKVGSLACEQWCGHKVRNSKKTQTLICSYDKPGKEG